MAADAKATGGELSDLKSAVEKYAYGETTYSAFTQGSRSTSNPYNIISHTGRITIRKPFELKAGDIISVSGTYSDFKYAIAGKTSTTTYDSGWKTSDFTYQIPASGDGTYFVNAAHSDESSALLPSESTIVVTIIDSASNPSTSKKDIAVIKDVLAYGNSGVVQGVGYLQTTYQGVTYTKISGTSVRMQGTSTATSFYDLFTSESSLPDGIEPGKTYSFAFLRTNSNVTLRIYFYFDGDFHSLEWFSNSNGKITVPSNATGMTIRVGMTSGVTVNETVSVMFFTSLSNDDLAESINVVEQELTNSDSITWYKAVMNADGTYNTSSNGASTVNIIKNPLAIYIQPGVNVVISLYKNGGYIGKIAANGSINKTSGDWKRFQGYVDLTPYLQVANADGIRISIIPTNGYTFTDANVNISANNIVKIVCNKYLQERDIQEDKTVLSISEQNPLYPYYNKFEFKSIVNENNAISLGTSSNIRCSTIVRFDKPVYLSMINPDYSFGIYWYDENDVYHSKLWDTMWEVPANVDVGIAIRRHEASSNSETIVGETPWIYLHPFNDSPKDYFLSEIEDTINKVKAAYTEPGLCFFLSTDQHYMSTLFWLLKYDSISDMVTNMKAVAKEIPIDGNISLGDIADYKIPGSTAKAEQFGIKDMSYANLDEVFYHWMRYAIKQLKSVHPNLIYVHGNHDDNRYLNQNGAQATVSEWDYTEGEVFSYYISNSVNSRVSNVDNYGLDYYIDYPQYKIRIVVIDSNYYSSTSKSWNYGYEDSTVSWLNTTFNNTPSDYSVLLLSHMSPVYTHNADNNLYPNFDLIQNAIQTYINNGGDFIGTLYGHSHCDWNTSNPWLDITFAAQRFGTNTSTYENMPNMVCPTKTIGTATEDCWNVLIIQPQSRKIKIIRFGAGDDAEYSY